MLIEVSEFCRRAVSAPDLQGLVNELRAETGREGDSEAFAWRSSLPVLASALSAKELARLHLYFDRRGRMELEYRLPASGACCDAVLLGQGRLGPASVIIELKHWATADDRPGPTESLVVHAGSLYSHPSVQVGGYVEYCQRFHSAVQQHQAGVHGCVLFTRTTHLAPYLQPPHSSLVKDYPIFGCGDADLTERLPKWITTYVSEPNERFAIEFSDGTYQQDRRFVRQVADLLQNPHSSPFVLLDEQRRAYDVILLEIERHAQAASAGQRLVVLVEGPPGSGKSVLAAQLWARMAVHPVVDGNVVLCTTSSCQRSNWKHLFRQVARNTAGEGLVVGANAFNPGLQPAWINEQRAAGEAMTVGEWRNNLEVFRSRGRRTRSPDLHFATTIVDEAHALIDPTAPNAEGVSPSGWCMHAGPQVWHIIRSSRVTVLLMDSEQSYRDNETTTPEEIVRYAESFGSVNVVRLSLRGSQFRCGGSVEYTDWVEDLLQTSRPARVALEWRRTPHNVSGKFEFEILPSPLEVEAALRSRLAQGNSVRLIASYARPWLTQDLPDPHNVPERQKDFCIPVQTAVGPSLWGKIWNYAPDQDYTFFVQARQGSPIHRDPLCEVGCPYVVRGFDFDYVGLLWLSDLVWREGRWVVQGEHVHETAWRKTRAAARRRDNPEAARVLLRRVQRGYRILLTRGIKGVFVWCEDDETRQHLESCLHKSPRSGASP